MPSRSKRAYSSSSPLAADVRADSSGVAERTTAKRPESADLSSASRPCDRGNKRGRYCLSPRGCLLAAAWALPSAVKAFVPALSGTGAGINQTRCLRRTHHNHCEHRRVLNLGGRSFSVSLATSPNDRRSSADGHSPLSMRTGLVGSVAAGAAAARVVAKAARKVPFRPPLLSPRSWAADRVDAPYPAAASAATTSIVRAASLPHERNEQFSSSSPAGLLVAAARQLMDAFRERSGAPLRRCALSSRSSSLNRGSAAAAAAARPVIRLLKSLRSLGQRRRVMGVALASAAAFVLFRRPAFADVAAPAARVLAAMVPSAGAGGADAGPAVEMTLESVMPRLALWFTLFVTSAAFHSAEIAITTLYPWKVKEFAEEEGESSPFQVLNKDITRVLTTILVATTVCTIYNAALFTNLAIQLFGSAGLAYATAALTVTTLFFGELLPKALGVNNAEVVARRVLPVIILLSVVLNPIAQSFTLISKLMLSMFGFKSTETGRVSEEELRLIVTGAKMSGGIESQEGMMIEGVLDLQDTKISEIMRPRVEVVAIEANSTMMDLYALHQETKYSRIPVYSGEIDRISGVVLSKDLLDFVQEPEKLSSVLVADETESTYFVPETMSVWNVLEEMRKRRLHMAIVVDEYGGTAGVVTLEDILEEVVGEIYDETEDDELREEEHYINLSEDGSFTIHGMADLEDVCTSLAFQEVNEDDLKEFGTLSGYLCSQAGEIPAVGDYVMVGGYMFTVTKADERRIEEVHARLMGAAPDAEDGPDAAGSQAGPGGDQGGSGGNAQQQEEAPQSDRQAPGPSAVSQSR